MTTHPATTLVAPFSRSSEQSAPRTNHRPDPDGNARSIPRSTLPERQRSPALPDGSSSSSSQPTDRPFTSPRLPFTFAQRVASSSCPRIFPSNRLYKPTQLQRRKRVSPFCQLRKRVHVRENDGLLLVRDVSLHEPLINLVRQQAFDFLHWQLHPRDG